MSHGYAIRCLWICQVGNSPLGNSPWGEKEIYIVEYFVYLKRGAWPEYPSIFHWFSTYVPKTCHIDNQFSSKIPLLTANFTHLLPFHPIFPHKHSKTLILHSMLQTLFCSFISSMWFTKCSIKVLNWFRLY